MARKRKKKSKPINLVQTPGGQIIILSVMRRNLKEDVDKFCETHRDPYRDCTLPN